MFKLILTILALHVKSHIWASSNDLDEVTLYFFTGSDFDNDRAAFNLPDASKILENKYFRQNSPTVIYIHGYNESLLVESVRTVTNAYLINGEYNTIVLDWSSLSGGLYPFVVGNVNIVGDQMVQVLLDMFSAGLPVSEFHLVGHSLGGQMAGIIGRGVQENSNQQIVLERVTALDPAGPLYYELLDFISIFEKPIGPSDARFIDIIHTDAGFLGQAYAGGHVDFWPNAGTRFQPGCPIIDSFFSLPDQLCSHTRSWLYWSESLVNSHNPNTFSAAQSTNWESFRRGNIDKSRIISMGINCPRNVAGSWFLQTNYESPFSLGENGIHYNDQKGGLISGIANSFSEIVAGIENVLNI